MFRSGGHSLRIGNGGAFTNLDNIPMAVKVIRKDMIFEPDISRVIARFRFAGEERGKQLIESLIALPTQERDQIFNQVMRKYSVRHRSIRKIFMRHFNRVSPLVVNMEISVGDMPESLKLLIGAYFTMEYSIEAAAFFNPSIVEHPDQSLLSHGHKRVIISFRATGEGHISSIVFRQGILDEHNNIDIDPPGRMLEVPEHVRNHIYHKATFLRKLREMCEGGWHTSEDAYRVVEGELTDTFTHDDLRKYLESAATKLAPTQDNASFLQEVYWLASSNYEMTFSVDTAVCERVVFPFASTERNGIEDARFVRFVDDDQQATYYATYTAYDGITILPKLLQTQDFLHFKVMPIYGHIAQNKGMALFPRKIDGKFVMLCQIDGINNYIAYSDNINIWREAELIQKPKYPWELVQIGNCGSPLETEAGWLVITHGVGPMREYVLGASLLDLANPRVEIGRLSEPLIIPNRREREGYVPNVVYSCGAYIHASELVIPYAMSDHASTYAVVKLDELLAKLLRDKASNSTT